MMRPSTRSTNASQCAQTGRLRSSVLLSASLFGPSAPLPTMASADFCNRIQGPLDPRSRNRHVCRSPRVLRTHLHAYARRIYVTAFHTCIGLCILWPAHPTVTPLSASCSSRQRFASGFLPTLSHLRRRYLPLTLAHVGCVEDFHLRVGAPCRAHHKMGPWQSQGPIHSTKCLP